MKQVEVEFENYALLQKQLNEASECLDEQNKLVQSLNEEIRIMQKAMQMKDTGIKQMEN